MAGQNMPDNPYLAARNEWNERYGSYVKAAAAWRIVGIIGMTMAVIGFAYALYQSTQVKLIPYVVEVDKLGTAVNAGVPQQIEYADPRVVRARLSPMVKVMDVLGFRSPAAEPSEVILTEDILDVADPDIADGIILHAKGLGLPIRRLKRLTSFGLEDLAACFVTILQAEAWESNKALFERYSATIEPGIAERLRKGAALSSSEVDQARKMREMFRAQMADVFAGAAPLALPTITTSPPERGAGSDMFVFFRSACMRLLCLAGLTGYPQLAFPISVSGKTFSFSLMGNTGSDRALAEMAFRLGAPP